jgi:nondiscriminating glutamyl-tRNA synthetase
MLQCLPWQSTQLAYLVATPVRVRIAPSPTGNLHLGTARTALYNYLYAKRHDGTFVLRLEDTDEIRSDENFTKDIVDGLHWLNLNWDEGIDIGGPYAPYRQTEKIDHYEKMAKKLITSGQAYFCYCTPEELNTLKEDQKGQGTAVRYDNRCRHLTSEQADRLNASGRVPAVRFKIEEPRIVSWNDLIKGTISIDSSDLGGDMVIVKSNGMAIYNFAVVIDDLDMKMSQVIRGEDHIHNTAKQLMIYEAFGVDPPEFGHAPLIFDSERRKLSKRHHGEMVHIDKYRNDGYMPEAVVNYLAQMSWTPADNREIFTLEEASAIFDLERVSKSPAIFDLQKLNWFNSHYIRHLPLDEIVKRALPYLQAYDLSQYSKDELSQIIAIAREGLTMLKGITDEVEFFFAKKVEIPQDVNESLMNTEASRKVLHAVLERLPEFPWGQAKGCKEIVDKIGKELGLKGKDLYWPIRAALQGKTSGPDLGATLAILGKDRVKSRIEGALGLCPQT